MGQGYVYSRFVAPLPLGREAVGVRGNFLSELLTHLIHQIAGRFILRLKKRSPINRAGRSFRLPRGTLNSKFYAVFVSPIVTPRVNLRKLVYAPKPFLSVIFPLTSSESITVLVTGLWLRLALPVLALLIALQAEFHKQSCQCV